MRQALMLFGRTSSIQKSVFVISKRAAGQAQSAISTGKVGLVKVKKGSLIPRLGPSLKALNSIGADGVNLRAHFHKSTHANFGPLPLPQMRSNKRVMMVNRRTLTVRGAALCSQTLSVAKIAIFPTFVCGQITPLKLQKSTDYPQVVLRLLPTN